MSQPNVYALLIAIDAYRRPVPALSGCVRDSQDMEAWLRANVPEGKLHLRTLRDKEATKPEVIDGFLNHLAQATPDDVVFIHYAGHGSQEPSPREFWHLEPDKKNETLVLYDSRRRIGGVYQRDLADKELGALIYEVSRTGAHLVSMFDCCHSGDNTRDLGATPRQSPAETQARTLDHYFFMQRDDLRPRYEQLLAESNGRLTLPVGSHVQLAGCKSIQTAKELTIGGKRGGVFTYAILQALQQSKGNLSYRDLVKRATAFVRNKVAEQDPQIGVLRGSDAGARPVDSNATFLSGAARNEDPYFEVAYERSRGGWLIEAGSLQGVPTSAGEQETTIAIYPNNVNVATQPDAYTMLGRIKSVQSTYTTIDFLDTTGQLMPNPPLDQTATLKARLLNLPVPKTRVRFEAEDSLPAESQKTAVSLLAEALDTANPNSAPARYLERVREAADFDYRVLAYRHKGNDRYAIHRGTDVFPLVKQVDGFTAANAVRLLEQLSAISRWDQTRDLFNPNTSIKADEVGIEVLARRFEPESGWSEDQALQANENGDLRIPFVHYGGPQDRNQGVTPALHIRIHNRSRKNLHFALLYMASDFTIQNILFEVKELAPGESFSALGGNDITPQVPQELLKLGQNTDTATLKLIASTTPFDTMHVEQQGMAYPDATRALGAMNSLDQILGQNQTRALSFASAGPPTKVSDWTTDAINLEVVRKDGEASEAALAQAGVSIERPEGVDFELNVTNLGGGTGNTRNLLATSVLTADAHVVHPYHFVAGRGEIPSQNLIELHNMQNPRSVTPNNPLNLRFSGGMAENEALISISAHGSLLYPQIARQRADGSALLQLDKLREPHTQSRDLKHTFRLLIHKVLSGKFGFEDFPYPRLALVKRDEAGKAAYVLDASGISAGLRGAQRILLLSHGITGYCDECFFQPTQQTDNSFLDFTLDRYDAVLTFDYESYNTPIQTTAAELQRQLVDVGLGPAHGKQLDMLVHSMGGLLARYFIEVQRGDQIVSNLVMAGTPNGGSPWPKIIDWALFGATILLNNIPVVGWPIAAFGYLINIAKQVDSLDKTTDAMKPDSEFLRQLAAQPDPRVPYTIIAGNTSTIPYTARNRSFVYRSLRRAGIRPPDYNVLKQMIFRRPNDIAVGTKSIMAVPGYRKPAPVAFEVPSNHFDYFNTTGGLNQVMQALEKLPQNRR